MTRLAGFALIVSALCFFAAPPSMAAVDPNSLSDLKGEMDKGITEVNAATKDAQANKPTNADAKTKEDELDAAVRKNDEQGANPKAAKEKAENEEKAAQKAADATAKNDGNAAAYRAALKKRRDARKQLKTVCAQLATLVQKRRKNLGPEAVKEAEDVYKKCLETLNGATNVIAAAFTPDDGPALGLQPGQDYVSRPEQPNDGLPPEDGYVARPDTANDRALCFGDAACLRALELRGTGDGNRSKGDNNSNKRGPNDRTPVLPTPRAPRP